MPYINEKWPDPEEPESDDSNLSGVWPHATTDSDADLDVNKMVEDLRGPGYFLLR